MAKQPKSKKEREGKAPRPVNVDLSDRELAAWRGFLGTHRAVLARIDAGLEAAHELTVSDYDVLRVLADRSNDRLRMSELADAAQLTRSGMTRLVDRLARKGLVERERCPDDGRGFFCVLTQTGQARLNAAGPLYEQSVRTAFLTPLGKKQQRALVDAWTLLGATG